MPRYAVAAVPWVRVTVAGVLVLALMDLVRRWPGSMWPLEGVSVGLLAAATAWCFDEQTASVVDTAPRSLAWRTLARSPGPLVLLAVWMVATHLARDSLFGHRWEVALQGVGAVVAATAYTGWRRAAGTAMPGLPFAMCIVPLATGWALIRPFSRELPILPFTDLGGAFGDWEVSRSGWGGLLVCSAALLALALGDSRWCGQRAWSRPTRHAP